MLHGSSGGNKGTDTHFKALHQSNEVESIRSHHQHAQDSLTARFFLVYDSHSTAQAKQPTPSSTTSDTMSLTINPPISRIRVLERRSKENLRHGMSDRNFDRFTPNRSYSPNASVSGALPGGSTFSASSLQKFGPSRDDEGDQFDWSKFRQRTRPPETIRKQPSTMALTDRPERQGSAHGQRERNVYLQLEPPTKDVETEDQGMGGASLGNLNGVSESPTGFTFGQSQGESPTVPNAGSTYAQTMATEPVDLSKVSLKHEEPAYNDYENLRLKLLETEQRLKEQDDLLRDKENERRSTARSLNILVDEFDELKGRYGEVKDIIEAQRQEIASLRMQLEETMASMRPSRKCDCLSNGILRSLELDYQETRNMLQSCTSELRNVQAQQNAVRQKCVDIRESMQELNSWNARSNQTKQGSNRSIHFDTTGEPGGAPNNQTITPDEEFVKMVRALNDQVVKIADEISNLVTPASSSKSKGKNKAVSDTAMRDRLQRVIGRELFQYLEIRPTNPDQTSTNDLSEVKWAIQTTLSHLLSEFSLSWPRAPALLLEDNKGWGIGSYRIPIGLQQPNPRIHEGMVSKTEAFINEILSVTGLVGVGEVLKENTRAMLETFWRTANLVTQDMKSPGLKDEYTLLVAKPQVSYDEDVMVLDGPRMDSDESNDLDRSWMIDVLCTTALGLEKIGGSGRKEVLEKVRVVQQWT